MNAAHPLGPGFNSGQTLYGTFLAELLAPGVVDILGKHGFDFVMVDAEHGMYGAGDIRRLIDAGHRTGLCTMVRAPSVDRGFATRVLDAGAQGILFPQIRSMEQVRQAVEISKYAPVGSRGVHRYRPHTNFEAPDHGDWRTFLAEKNAQVLTMVQIETRDVRSMIGDIAATEGIDVLYIGPADLSVELGCPGQYDHPDMQAVFHAVRDACRDHGKVAGSHLPNATYAKSLVAMGYRLLGYASGLTVLADGVKQFFNGVPRSVPQTQPAAS